MEVFYAHECDGAVCRLDAEESAHCVRVLRCREGDEVHVVDGAGTMYRCRLTDAHPKAAEAVVLETFPRWNAHPYHLSIGCCPTKNNERFEWFVEKAVELGVDEIIPLIGARSERKVYKKERAERIGVAASKQSLKARFPDIRDAASVDTFLKEPREGLKLIACCFEDAGPRRSIREVLEGMPGQAGHDDGRETGHDVPCITVLIGPEGDFSPQEAALAVRQGYIPVHLGASRLRTETAAVTAVSAVYFHFL